MLVAGGLCERSDVCGYGGYKFAGDPKPFREETVQSGISHCMWRCIVADTSVTGATKNRKTVRL